MNQYVGLDVLLEETKIHVLDEAGGPPADRVSNLGRPIPVCPSCGGHALTAERTMIRQMPDTREAYRIV
jgi:hypothetical protein